MDNLFFPQLVSGALAQYPIRKSRFVRTVKNVLDDGSIIATPDPSGGRMVWELRYTELSGPDVQLLQSHFDSCGGALRGFTFIDPTANMLSDSYDLTSSVWNDPSGLIVGEGTSDPEGGATAFTLTNTGQANEEISQTLIVPAAYQLCFSVYARSDEPTTVTLGRRGGTANDLDSYAVGPVWSRLVSTGRLSDPTTTFTAAIAVTSGQQIQVFGPQLEPQINPSHYRPTNGLGGVYPNAHWAVERLPIIAIAPNLFSTVFSIETIA